MPPAALEAAAAVASAVCAEVAGPAPLQLLGRLLLVLWPEACDPN